MSDRSIVGEIIEGLIEFDLSPIPSSATISSAELFLYHSAISAKPSTFDFYRMTSPWSEGTVTYTIVHTGPIYNTTSVASLTISDTDTGVWRKWDVTSVVQDWHSGTHTNYGLLLSPDVSGSLGPSLLSSDFASNSDFHPKLTVEYVPLPGAVWLLGSGLIAVIGFRRKLKR